ncbi:CocE/NonD family hydrolase [Pelagibius sp.]
MPDGVHLAARIWLPDDADRNPVPALLNYKPYRKRDFTTAADALSQTYLAGHGYAGVRVDMRGSGDSEGVLRGEYLDHELDDAVEVIAWLARQPWCSGQVGMYGLSWSGFNSLQVAARRPPALKAIISACSSDDRYADDVHMMGGCLLTDKLTWGASMLARYMSPPDPAVVGDKWRDMWLERLRNNGLWVAEWHEHQRRDGFYKHGSISEDYSAIECPTYLVGGWLDAYSNTIFRMAERLRCPRKALIGPWPHKYPYRAKPGPQIGFLQEAIRWWDHWLKGRDTGIMEEPMLRVWMRDAERPRRRLDKWRGRWVAETKWPAADSASSQWFFRPGRLTTENDPLEPEIEISSPQTAGHTMGAWCPHGIDPDLPGDQRYELGHVTAFDSDVLGEPVEILGASIARLDIASDSRNALVAGVLSEVFPDGSATLITYGVFNLTHHDSDEAPKELEPGKHYSVDLRLNEIAHRFAAGNRIRLAISTSFWPTVWPSPTPVVLRLRPNTSHLSLPVRDPKPCDEDLTPLPAPEVGPPSTAEVVSKPSSDWTVTRELESGRLVHRRVTDSGLTRLDHGWEFGKKLKLEYSVVPDDPLSAQVLVRQIITFGRGDWSVRIESTATMKAERNSFRLHAALDCFESDQRVHTDNWDHAVPRDCV